MKKVFKWFFISVLTIIALGVPTIYLIILNSPAVSATWYDDNWAYRKRIDVTVVSNSSDISNLQMLLTVDTSTSGIASGKMQASCQDLRFTSTNGKVLPYYIDSGCTTTTTKIWVMVDLVPKNTTSMTLFMYYGNPSAVAGSNSQPYFDNVVGLVGYWTLNETSGNSVTDSSITGVTGTATDATAGNGDGNTPPPYTASGQYAGARAFDGTDDYVNNGTSVNPLTNLTVEGWIYLNNTSGEQSLIGKFNASASTEYGWRIYQTGTTLTGDVFNSSQTRAYTTTTFSSTSTWAHVAMTYDGSNVKLYLNGVLQNTAPQTGTIQNVNQPITLGARPNSSVYEYFMNGRIDDVKIYNTARTATQILNDYNNKLPNGQTLTIASTAPTTVIPTTSFASEEKAPSPAAYWKFDDGQGTNAQDSTTNNADGTLAGTTIPAWKTEDLCISGKCLYFDGLTSKVTVSKVLPSVQTVSMWVKPNTSASTALIDLDGGTHKITTDASSVLSATGFDIPTIYVNGKVSSTLTANSWNYVTITTATSFASTSSLTIGLTSSTYFKGFIDEVKIYPYARSASQIAADYNSRSNNEGASSQTGSSGSSGSSASSDSLSNGLVGYWKMDESSANSCTGGTNDNCDASGNGNDGAWNGDATSAAGKFGNGTTFDGTGDYVNVGSGLGKPSTYTISTWVKPNAWGTTAIVFSTGPGDVAATHWGIFGQSASNVEIYTSNGSAYQRAVADSWNSTNYPSTAFTHIVATVDGSNIKYYRNGALISTIVQTITNTGTGQGMSIGRLGTADSFYFTGQIDETRIYNRALSPQEVSALYNFAPPPKVYLKMDEGTGTSANDSSGNGRTGTINGNPIWNTGKYGKGLKMDGTGDNIQVSDF